MARYKHLMIHCSATLEDQNLTPQDIVNMHCWPKDLEDGKVRYGGQVYDKREDLPAEVQDKHGRGWRVPGYSIIVDLAGEEHVIRDWDGDDFIDADEVTNGAKGMNGTTRHVCYIGGLSKAGKNPAKDTRTKAQKATLIEIVKREIAGKKNLLVLGHNEVANKACPSFNVPEWLAAEGIRSVNIYATQKKDD